MISGVRNICVRSYKFDQPMQFSDKDMDLLRSQFGDSSWAKMVNVRNQKTGENVDVLYQMKDGLFAGFAVIVAQPLEFTLVRIDGEIDLSQLAKLGGSLGLPKLNMQGQSNPEQKK